LFNQGTITAAAYTDERGAYVEAGDVVARDGGYFFDGYPVERHDGKMGKSLKNAVAPDDIYRDYGADTLRLYEMFMGPLDASRPWSTADIIGVYRLLQRLWRNLVDEDTGAMCVSDAEASLAARRALHRAVAAVRADMVELKFNTAIARLFELTNLLSEQYPSPQSTPREIAEPLVLMLAPLTPHIAEELWERLGHDSSLAFHPFPEADPALLVDDDVEVPVQVNGKVRGRIRVATGATDDEHERVARADPRITELLAGATVRKVVVVPGRTVNFVVV
jgi:leucyl-tRNA synthetase